MDLLRQVTNFLWTKLRPIAPSAIAVTIAILTIILLICIGSNLAQQERDGMQEGMVGGVWEAVGSEYPKSQLPTGLLGAPTSSCTTVLPGPVIENVPFDPRWVTARAGWAYGRLTGLNSHGLPMTSSDSDSDSESFNAYAST